MKNVLVLPIDAYYYAYYSVFCLRIIMLVFHF